MKLQSKLTMDCSGNEKESLSRLSLPRPQFKRSAMFFLFSAMSFHALISQLLDCVVW